MPLPALLLIIATCLPLVSFGVLAFLGKRIGNPIAGYVATAAIGGSFACSIVTMMLWLGGGKYTDPALGVTDYGAGKAPINLPVRWVPAGAGVNQPHPGFLDVGLYVDSLTVAMFSMVTLVAGLVHVFSLGYMADDPRFARYFTYLGLFCFSMLGLVLGGTLLQLFICWELVGFCSYLLIGFWYEKRTARHAAFKAFLVNRVGDAGFLVGFGILFCQIGNATLPGLWTLLGSASAGQAVTLPGGGGVIGTGLLTVMGIALFCGAIAKSAQFPLHVWLPDAMEGPTPISALIHAATMVAAGVYLVGRIFPILTPDARLFIAIIGCVTLTMAALIAVAQSDIKQVLAYSTVSQLGYMILALGVGSWVGGLFHLLTHAFFKALLFLGAGSVIHAAGHEQEMARYGGLFRKLPITAITFGIAVLAIAGAGFVVADAPIGFAGFYSKDMVLAHAGAFAQLARAQGRSPAYALLFWLPTGVACLTAFYMMRCWMLTFWGRPRDLELHGRAGEQPVMFLPLVILAAFSVVSGAGWFGVRDMLENSIKESKAYCGRLDPNFAGFDTAWPARVPSEDGPEVRDPSEVTRTTPRNVPDALLTPSQRAHRAGHELVDRFVIWAFILGLGGGFLVYMNGLGLARRLHDVPPLRWLHTWLYRRMYVDELYGAAFVAITVGLSRCAAFVDRHVVDGLVNLAGRGVRGAATLAGLGDRYVVDGAVNGVGALARGVGAAARAPQTGRVRVYVTALLLAVALGLAAAIIVVLSR